MKIVVAPTAALAPTPPAVGIFWRVNGVLVIDRSTLDEAEPYGDCLTHAAGHYERWQEWQALGVARLAALGYPGSYRVDRIRSVAARPDCLSDGDAALRAVRGPAPTAAHHH